ncbi:MAG TPA: DUF4190 domain-containing protein [Blastocatellia bacterium]|nr:DUF4190 domain-containing protein [Blastocatellia bacterium]
MESEHTYEPAPIPRKGLAITSLVLGIIGLPTLGLCFVGGIGGILLGVMALNKVKSDPARYGGKGMAIAGIITSAVSCTLAIPGIIAAIAIPNLIKSQQAAHETAALNEVLAIGRAQVQYSVTKGHGKYTDLRTLNAQGLIDATLASGQKGGYEFTSEPVVSGSQSMFDTTAIPAKVGTFGSGNRSFGSNETMIVYEAEGAVLLKATPTDRRPAGGTPVE